MKKSFKILYTLIFSIFLCMFFKEQVYSMPEINGEGMVLMDYTTGEILASKNANERMAPASTTKIMTALLTFEKCNLNDIVKVGVNPPNAEGSSIGLKVGDEYTVEELLYALLLESANDAAVALAEHIGGSEQDFAIMMNNRAKELGAKDTHFANASGLSQEDHYTTPYDLALIMKEVSKIPKFSEISSQVTHEMPVSIIDNVTKWVNNRNSLLYMGNRYYYEPIICSKTGYTTNAKHTYVATAEKDGQKLILSLFKYDSKQSYYEDTKKLFDYGFDNFKTIKLYSKNDIIENYVIDDNHSVSLVIPDDIYTVININDLKLDETINTISNINDLKNKSNIKLDIINDNSIIPGVDISKGEELFTANILKDSKVISTFKLLSGDDITYTKAEVLSIDIQNNTGKYITYVIVTIFIILLMLLIARIIYVKNRRKRRRKRSKSSSRIYYSSNKH